MSKRSIVLVFILTTLIIMFGIFKNVLGQQDNSQLNEALQNGAFLVDVRSPMEFASGSAKGAVNIPLDRIHGQLAKFRGKQSIVVFCRSGSRSSQARSILINNGFQNVINGGTWQNVLRAQQK